MLLNLVQIILLKDISKFYKKENKVINLQPTIALKTIKRSMNIKI